MSENMDGRVTNIQTLSYPGCIEAAKEIISYISQFDIESVACAVFCINSWHENRSCQNITYALNAALLAVSNFGTNQISDYDEFSTFFTHVKCILPPPTFLEDEVVPVMGQTLIPFKGKWRKALHGCGTTLEYPRLCFADAIIEGPREIIAFNELLDYVEAMSQELGGGGWEGSISEPDELKIPPSEYWYQTFKWINASPFRSISANTMTAIQRSTNYVENKCFVMDGKKPIPLFCPSILQDYLSHIIANKQADEYRSAIDTTLLNQARFSYDSVKQRGSSVLAFPLFVLNGEPIEKCPATFLIIDGENRLTLFYNASCVLNDSGLLKLKSLFSQEEIAIEILDYVKHNGQRRKLVVSRPNTLEFTVVAYHDNVDMNLGFRTEMRSEVADYDCGAADLMAILMAANSASEICSFFHSVATSPTTLLSPIVAASDYFIVWMANNQQILDGVEDRDAGITLALDYNETDGYFAEYFRNSVVDFPFDRCGKWILGSPYAFTFRKNERGFIEIIGKSDHQSFGLTKRLLDMNGEPCFIHLGASIESAKDVPPMILEQGASVLPLFEDLLMCLVLDAEPEIASLISGKGYLELIYVMPGGAAANSLPTVDEQLGIKAFYTEMKHSTVFYSVDSETFVNAISRAQDRSTEMRFAWGILSPVRCSYSDAMDSLAQKLTHLAQGQKMVDAESLALPYIWRYGVEKPALTETSKVAALKAVAYAIDDENVKSGRYFGSAANDVIRKFQKALSTTFENRLMQFDRKDLLEKFYDILANSSHTLYVNTVRYGSFSNLQDEEEKRVYATIFEQREDSRYEIQAARFSVETLLTLSSHGSRIANSDEVAKLVAIGGQLLSASEVADMLMFEPKGMGVEIAENCVATLIEDEGILEEARALKSRQLRDEGHAGSNSTEDAKYIQLSKDAFEEDTGVSFNCFLDVLNSLALSCPSNFEGDYVSSNVLSIESSSLVNFVKQDLLNNYTDETISDALDFLTLDTEKLKEIDGRSYDYLPFGNTKKRLNRLELKPIINDGGQFMYSPICMGLLKDRWVRGLAERFLPAKLAFPSLNKVMESWKHLYEKALESDVQDYFLKAGFLHKHVYRGVNLCKKGDHPQYLGDYDGLAYDPAIETVWVIECKEFEKIESAFDYMQLQQRWFGKDGKLLKYERRIKNLQEHLVEVAADLGFDHTEKLRIRPYLVSNKLFMNALGQSNFQVITLSELGSLLEKENGV